VIALLDSRPRCADVEQPPALRRAFARQDDDGAAAGVGSDPKQLECPWSWDRETRRGYLADFDEELARPSSVRHQEKNTVDLAVPLFECEPAECGLAIRGRRLGFNSVPPGTSSNQGIPRSLVADAR
jgi:hypothetical protein